MAKKSKLLNALDAAQGRNYYLERQSKMQKAAEKKKRLKAKAAEEGETKDEAEAPDATDQIRVKKSDAKAEQQPNGQDAASQDEHEDKEKSESDEDEDRKDDEKEHKQAEEEDDDDDEGEEEEEDIPLSDLSGDDAVDVIPHQRLTINNSAAIRTALNRISFLTPATPFVEHQSLVSPTTPSVPDPNDDLALELAFYTIAVGSAGDARAALKAEGVPFSRPRDYFAEMVKTDEHMERVRRTLADEAAAAKASAEAKRQRNLKKFGKQVQVARMQQRSKEKRETLEKIDSLKRKRKAGGTTAADEEDMFDVALEEGGKPERSGRGKGAAGKAGQASSGKNPKRLKKDAKFGFGGKKRHAKSGDAISSGDMSGFSVARMKGKKGAGGGAAKRPGKSRRAAKRG